MAAEGDLEASVLKLEEASELNQGLDEFEYAIDPEIKSRHLAITSMFSKKTDLSRKDFASAKMLVEPYN